MTIIKRMFMIRYGKPEDRSKHANAAHKLIGDVSNKELFHAQVHMPMFYRESDPAIKYLITSVNHEVLRREEGHEDYEWIDDHDPDEHK